MNSLKETIVGAWKLISYTERHESGSPDTFPMGPNPAGLIIYSSDGYMSAQIMNPNRINFDSDDWFEGTAAEYKQEATTYIAYSGKYEVDQENEILRHSMYVSLFPNWTGQTQERNVKIDNGTLKLSSAKPLKSKGNMVRHHLEWVKVNDK
jgi:hypothetical protein